MVSFFVFRRDFYDHFRRDHCFQPMQRPADKKIRHGMGNGGQRPLIRVFLFPFYLLVFLIVMVLLHEKMLKKQPAKKSRLNGRKEILK